MPFLLLALMGLVLARPWPVFPPPAGYRLVTDASGTEVKVPAPLHGVLPGWLTTDFLEWTHAPDSLFRVGGPKDRAGFAKSLPGRIYPQIIAQDSLWTAPGDLESQLAAHDSQTVYLTGGESRFGMAGFNSAVIPEDEAGLVDAVRAANRLIGHEERAAPVIASYQERQAGLDAEIQPLTLAHWPRAMTMGSLSDNWSVLWARGGGSERTGLSDAAEGWESLGRESDAERVLAMDPEVIYLWVGASSGVLHDPRWQGLKAVRTRRVYGVADFQRSIYYSVDLPPFAARWQAEVAHPERLQPKLRGLMRDYYLKTYGYRLSDAELDDMLSVAANPEAAGYARFRAGAPGADP